LRRNQLLAAGVSVALLLGAATPAFAKPNKGKALGHQNNTPADSRPAKGPKPAKPNPKPKPPKKTPAAKGKKSGVSGGGVVTDGTFSIQARNNRPGRLAKGHFNYTSNDEAFKLRCRDFSAPGVFSITDPPKTVTLTNAKCSLATVVNLVSQTRDVTINATFTDNGQPKSAVKDVASFTVSDIPDTTFGGSLTGGNIKVR
jgi:hypothetical protein